MGGTQRIVEISFDCAALPPDAQFATWAKFATVHYEVETSLPPERGFVSRSSAWPLGAILVNRSELGPVRMWRTPVRVRADSIDHYVLIMLETGTWDGTVGNRALHMEPGNICIMDMSRPMDCTGHGGISVTVLIPRLMLDEVLAPFDMHGLVLDAPAGKLLADYITALVARLPTLDAADAEPVARATRDLLAATLTTVRQRLAAKRSPSVLARAKRYITQNLTGDLSPGALCAALSTSRSSLFRAFEPLGGVARFVLARRLAKAHELLSRPDEHRSVAAIAFAVGFTSSTHFSRAFRAAYGYTARTMQNRTADQTLPPPAGKDVHDTYEKWGRRLR